MITRFFSSFLCFLFLTRLQIGFAQNKNQAFEEMSSKMASKSSSPVMSIDEVPKDNVIFLDAREKEEFNVSHIEGAIHVGFNDFDIDDFAHSKLKNGTVIVYCSVGYRSGKISEKLRKIGIKSYNLKGGLFGWHNKGRKVVNSSGVRTQKVHGYNKEWSQWVFNGDVTY